MGAAGGGVVVLPGRAGRLLGRRCTEDPERRRRPAGRESTGTESVAVIRKELQETMDTNAMV
ncbi:hypothetical protein ACWC5I_18415, partial [Kitasatospora sp. NPDC001574]